MQSLKTMEERHINEHLAKTNCYKCGTSLQGAKLTPISTFSVAMVAYTTCPNCQAESLLTITMAGSGLMPLVSDLRVEEVKEFIKKGPVSYKELFELHNKLKKNNIWKLLQK
jgi:uncharacterized protein (UPF0212 family)